MRSAVLAVCLTGSLAVAIPAGLLLGHDGLVVAGASRDLAIPAPRLVSCLSGHPIKDRQLGRGECVRLVGSGFLPQELILLTESRRPGWRTYLRADPLGGFSYRYLVAATAAPGADVLTFVGTDRSRPVSAPSAAFCRFTVSNG
ncbi:MAG TPA: hypothetical protein VMB79_02885 [Jatrophihabitans sp.]|nr:hypothetical protein [Jatrophihabitans sp.]